MPMFKKLSRSAAVLLIACGAIAGGQATASPETATQQSRSGTYLSDTAITAKVKAALLANMITGVSVTTEQGVVILAGTVPTAEMRQKANKIAADVSGVNEVDNEGLLVKGSS